MRLFAAVLVMAVLATSPTSAQHRTGVRDCDDVLQWMAACMRATAMPPQMMPLMQAALDQMQASWQSMAGDRDGRGALARTCRDYGGQMRQQLAGFGCRP